MNGLGTSIASIGAHRHVNVGLPGGPVVGTGICTGTTAIKGVDPEIVPNRETVGVQGLKQIAVRPTRPISGLVLAPSLPELQGGVTEQMVDA
jgi:hypothetical protein